MADTDDFEIIDDAGVSNEQLFEFVDVKDVTPKTQVKTPDVVLPLLVPKPVLPEPLPVVEQSPPPTPLAVNVNPPAPQPPTTTTTTSTTLRLEIRTMTTTAPPAPAPKSIPVVPPLPKARPLQRYGDAALIPHNSNETSDIDAAINRSKTVQQSILHMSSQQQHDIQTVLEQRRNTTNKI